MASADRIVIAGAARTPLGSFQGKPKGVSAPSLGALAIEGALMGKFAEDTAEKYQFTRQMQDGFATESLMRAKKATETGAFAREIAPVSAEGAEVTIDELPARADPAKIPLLKPAFREGGTV